MIGDRLVEGDGEGDDAEEGRGGDVRWFAEGIHVGDACQRRHGPRRTVSGTRPWTTRV